MEIAVQRGQWRTAKSVIGMRFPPYIYLKNDLKKINKALKK